MGRASALCLAAVLAAAGTAGCSDVDDLPLVELSGPSPTSGATADASPSAAAASTPATTDVAPPSGDAPPGTGESARTTEPAPEDSGGAALTPATDAGRVGVNGRAILRGDRPSLVIEVDVQSGTSVDDAATSHLVAALEDVVDKPAGIRFGGGNTFDSDRTEWTADALRSAVAANRTTATTDDEVSIHVLYVRGGHHDADGRTDAIGLAYSSSTVALFPDRWSGLGSLLGAGRAIERAVLLHEVGHLLGLVNLTYTSDVDHEDPDNPAHSSNEDSVMYHAVESTLVDQVFDGPPPDTFDLDDLADLEGLRSGRY